jgi:penicillin-binding protein 1B
LQRYPLTVQQTVNPAAVFALNFALREVVERGTARALNGLIPVAVAGKTGTTDELRDSWFAGFSGDVLAVAWVGRDDNKPTGLSGAKGALPVWAETMRHLPLQALQLVPPEGIEWAQIQGCGSSGRFPFLAGTSANARAQCTPPADEPQQDESPPSVNDDELF